MKYILPFYFVLHSLVEFSFALIIFFFVTRTQIVFFRDHAVVFIFKASFSYFVTIFLFLLVFKLIFVFIFRLVFAFRIFVFIIVIV